MTSRLVGVEAVEPQDGGQKGSRALSDGFTRLFGTPSRGPVVLAGEPELSIHVVEREGETLLHTIGASSVSSSPHGRIAEFVLRLPPEWDLRATLSADGDPRWRWPVDELVRVARGAARGVALAEGDTVTDPAGPTPFHSSTRLAAWLLLPATNPVGDVCLLELPGAEPVHALAMIPLHPSELAFMRERGLVPLLKELGWDQMTTVTDPDRPPVV